MRRGRIVTTTKAAQSSGWERFLWLMSAATRTPTSWMVSVGG